MKSILKFTHRAVLKSIIQKYGYHVPVGFKTMAKSFSGVDFTTIRRVFKILEREKLVTIEHVNKRDNIYHIDKDVIKIITEREKQLNN